MAVGVPLVGMPQAAVAPATSTAAAEASSRRRLTSVLQVATSPEAKRQLDDEPRPAAGGVLDPHRAAVEPHVLGDQRQPEAGAVARCPLAGPAAPVEALEEVVALVEAGSPVRGPRR